MTSKDVSLTDVMDSVNDRDKLRKLSKLHLDYKKEKWRHTFTGLGQKEH